MNIRLEKFLGRRWNSRGSARIGVGSITGPIITKIGGVEFVVRPVLPGQWDFVGGGR